jgi:hypothetical protein
MMEESTASPHRPRAFIAVIVDRMRVCAWQAEALRAIADQYDIVLLNCTNTRSSRRRLGHAFYYMLNLLALKTARTRRVAIPPEVHVRRVITFEAHEDGNWQHLPATVTAAIAGIAPLAIVKFGMGLLRVPASPLIPILSYHHGDPRYFRGRPAAFHEIRRGTRLLGQIVQQLTNQLDSGPVLAFAQTKIHRHSYRTTMDEAYRCSPLLMPTALRNALSGTALPFSADGANYRLPGNLAVLQFAGAMARQKFRRLIYAAFSEKIWQVARAPTPSADPQTVLRQFPPPATWRVVPQLRAYRFLADPFPHPEGGLLVEALRRSDSQGEIVHLGDIAAEVVCTGAGHFSYPATVRSHGSWFLVPEVAEWSDPRAYGLSRPDVEISHTLDVANHPRLIDPTLLTDHDNHVYLFANTMADGHGVLRLWHAKDLFGKFAEHPASPILISPRGARMGGAVHTSGTRLFRVGQDNSREYGDGIVLYEIREISSTAYNEAEIADFRFEHVKGPHTLNFADGGCLFDFYRERRSILAGVRRLQSRLLKQRVAADRTRPKKAAGC